MSFKVKDFVKYYPIKDGEAFEIRQVRSVHPDGIPSYQYPMLMLEGRAGVVVESHCELLGADSYTIEDGLVYVCSDGCEGCACHFRPPCAHCTDHCIGEAS